MLTESTEGRVRRPADRLALMIATGAGAGLIPVAPGTFGALEGVALYLLAAAPGRETHLTILLLVNVLVLGAGAWSAGRACDLLSEKDPARVVVDEIGGQMIALIPAALDPSITAVAAGFALFRAFDILKPYPIRRLERLPGGFGVMCDDMLAGVYAGALVFAWQFVRSTAFNRVVLFVAPALAGQFSSCLR